mmetsp:Transcript_1150/g.2112  ORF Transcript_1150/g.2112 Transcript_1150/m.2112 type:complete len:122 (+) Transcript_1150:423-788(+)
MLAAQLDWDKIEQEGFLEKLDCTNRDQCVECKFGELRFDMVIGSDVVYWPQSIKPLCLVLDALFKLHEEKLVFYICYVERIKNVHRELLETLKEMGFSVVEIAQEVTKPLSGDAFIYEIRR